MDFGLYRFFEDGRNNNKKKMSSDTRSVPDLKIALICTRL